MQHHTELSPQAQRILPWLVALTFFMQMLDVSIVNTALPDMAHSLKANPLSMQAVIISYSLTVALIIPASGWLTDRFGIRNIFIGAIVIFTIGSLACAAAPTLGALVAARILQGIGGAIMVPVGRLSILRAYPKEKLVQQLSFIVIPGLIGPLIGPALGGILVDMASWHWIFLINLPVGILAAFAALQYMPNLPPPDQPKAFDWSGFFIFGLSMVLFTLGLQGAGDLQLGLPVITTLLGFGCLFLIIYCFHAVKSIAPLFSPQLFKTRNFFIGILGNIVARLGMGGMAFFIPFYLQMGLHFTPMHAGLSMIPIAAAGMLSKSIVNRTLERFGYKKLLCFNTVALGLCIMALSFIHKETPVLLVLLFFFFFGALNSMQFSAMNTLTLIDIPPENASSGNSLLSTVMQLGVGMAVASATALLNLFSHTDFAHGSDNLYSFHMTFLCLGGITILSTIIFFFSNSTQKTSHPAQH